MLVAKKEDGNTRKYRFKFFPTPMGLPDNHAEVGKIAEALGAMERN